MAGAMELVREGGGREGRREKPPRPGSCEREEDAFNEASPGKR